MERVAVGSRAVMWERVRLVPSTVAQLAGQEGALKLRTYGSWRGCPVQVWALAAGGVQAEPSARLVGWF